MNNPVIPAEAIEAAESRVAQFQDALGDYYDAGMVGDAPRLGLPAYK